MPRPDEEVISPWEDYHSIDEFIEVMEKLQDSEPDEEYEEEEIDINLTYDYQKRVVDVEFPDGQKATLLLSYMEGIMANEDKACPACQRGYLELFVGPPTILSLRCRSCNKRYIVFGKDLVRLNHDISPSH